MNEQSSNQLATISGGAIQSFEQMEAASAKLSASGLMGPKTTPEMVFGLMLLCQCEGLNPIAAMKRYHIVEGRPSMRADAMQAEFLARGGAIIFHVRTDEMVAATLFSDKTRLDDAARVRSEQRFETLWRLDCTDPEDSEGRSKLIVQASKLSMDGEETIIRTFADCHAKGITNGANGIKANWRTSPRQMLTARVITEGVRLVNPGLIAGIYSEDETADIVRQEKEALRQIMDAPSERDKDAILEIIAGYDEELKTVTGERRKNVLGLRSDLVCKLGDIGIKAPTPPAEPEPTVAGRPVKMAEAAEVPATPTPTPAPEPQKAPATRRAPVEQQQARTEPVENLPWQEVVCHVGPNPGKMFDHKLGAIFTRPKSDAQLNSLVKWFQDTLGGSPIPKDVALWKAVEEAKAAWQPPDGTQKPASAPDPYKAPEQVAAPKETATPTDWRAFVIEVKTPDYAGKKLGEIDLKAFSADYLDKIDPARATLHQKKLKALVCQALAETAPKTIEVDEVLPPAANDGEPEHTKQLRDLIEVGKLNRNDFMKVCRTNGYISSTATRLEDITETEFTQLASEWPDVSKEVTAAQP